MILLCKDCRWVQPDTVEDRRAEGLFWRCRHSTSVLRFPPSRVTGRTPPPMPGYCSKIRDNLDGARCGPSGRFWEPKDGASSDPEPEPGFV